MGKHLINVGTITYAMRGRDILASKGISSYIQKSTSPGNGKGCGYGLYVPNNYREAHFILAEHGIKILNPIKGDESE